MAARFGRALDADLPVIVTPLVQRAGEVSTAGRDTFLAAVADDTLAAIVMHLTPSKVLHLLHCTL